MAKAGFPGHEHLRPTEGQASRRLIVSCFSYFQVFTNHDFADKDTNKCPYGQEKNMERIGDGANRPFLLPNWRNFATQLGSKFFLVGPSIRNISLTAGFILSSEAVFTCGSPNRGSYGIIPYISVPPFTPYMPYGFLMAVESRYVYIHYSIHQECFFDYLKAETDITLLRLGLITLRPKD